MLSLANCYSNILLFIPYKKSSFMKNLKLIVLSIIAVATVVLTMSSCSSEVDFDKELLIGKWQSNTLYEVYNADGTGLTWDTADDVTEAEAQAFTWELVGADLTQIHIMEMGGNIPKVYEVKQLDDTTLSYKDDYGKTHNFTRVK